MHRTPANPTLDVRRFARESAAVNPSNNSAAITPPTRGATRSRKPVTSSAKTTTGTSSRGNPSATNPDREIVRLRSLAAPAAQNTPLKPNAASEPTMTTSTPSGESLRGKRRKPIVPELIARQWFQESSSSAERRKATSLARPSSGVSQMTGASALRTRSSRTLGEIWLSVPRTEKFW